MYENAINELLEKNLTKRAYALWKQLNAMFPNIWDLPTSSTGKYHQKKDEKMSLESLKKVINPRVEGRLGFEKNKGIRAYRRNIIPFFLTVSWSLMNLSEATGQAILPRSPQWENYAKAWKEADFSIYFFNFHAA